MNPEGFYEEDEPLEVIQAILARPSTFVTGRGELNMAELNDIRKQAWDDSIDWFPELHERGWESQVLHMMLGMAGEVGEVANLVKKANRKSMNLPGLNDTDIGAELADVFIYLLHLSTLMGVDLAKEYASKRAFNQERFGKKTASDA